MEKVLKPGKTEPNTPATGETAWLKVKEFSITLTEMFTQENFIKIEQMASESMFILTGKNMKVSGKTICKMVEAKKS